MKGIFVLLIAICTAVLMAGAAPAAPHQHRHGSDGFVRDHQGHVTHGHFVPATLESTLTLLPSELKRNLIREGKATRQMRARARAYFRERVSVLILDSPAGYHGPRPGMPSDGSGTIPRAGSCCWGMEGYGGIPCVHNCRLTTCYCVWPPGWSCPTLFPVIGG